MLDAGRPGLIHGFCDQPSQCHVTAGRKTRENNLGNRNDFSY
jgi:hypothetical protein